MAQDNRYSKIVVSSEDNDAVYFDEQAPEEEETIYIGAGSSQAPAAQPLGAEPAVVAPAAVKEQTEQGQAPQAAAREPKKKDDAYHEQTLEDINNVDVPFLKVQRIVLIVAALFVIAFCVYWFALR